MFGTILAVSAAVWGFGTRPTLLNGILILGGGFVLACLADALVKRRQRPPAQDVRSLDGIYLGVGKDGRWRAARPERAVLVLGPPRSGKTSAVIIPTLLCHRGPVVSTSTKPDVLHATGWARSRAGRVWVFDPTASRPAASVGVRLGWSPVTCSASWDGAMLMARAIVSGARVGFGTSDASHWAKRAQALLAGLLHAASIRGRDIRWVLSWVMSHNLEDPIELLDPDGSPLARTSLQGLANTEARERSSIFSAAADALEAYTSEAALAAAREPNFDPAHFVTTSDTVYIHAPGELQALAAPLVCGLLAELRRETCTAHAQGRLAGRVLFALDEVANIAPVAELPQIATEGGGQGLALLAALQDLSQARGRWGQAADGFLTLFGSKLVLPGIADQQTLESISLALGEYDRKVVSETRTRSWQTGSTRGRTVSTQRQRVLSPGEIANIPAGHALYLDGVRWELVTLTPAHRVEPWRSLTGTSWDV